MSLDIGDITPHAPYRVRTPRAADDPCRFCRLDEARGADGGSELGLAIVASVMEAHGGGMDVGRSPLEGARLSIWLPAVSS